MAGKKRRLKDLRSHDDIVRADLHEDAEFRREWQRTAVARAVALRVVQHREKSGLSQQGLAEKLGMRQPQIARLERGDTTPDLSTLLRLAQGLGIEFVVDFTPAKRATRLVSAAARKTGIATQAPDGSRLLVATTE